MLRRHWKLLVGVAVSAVLLWLAFRGVHFAELGQSLADVRPAWLVPVVASILVRFWLTAIRWRVLLRPVKAIGVHRLFGITLIGFMANNLLPARMGEFVRAYALGKSESLPASLSFATIVLERVFDGFTLLLFLVVGVASLRPDRTVIVSAIVAFCVYLGVLGGLLWLRGGRGVGALVARLPARLQQRAAGLLESFTLGLEVLSEPRSLLMVTGLSLVIWLINVAGVWAMFEAYALTLPPQAAFVMLAVVALALVAPSTPGYVGPFQFATVVALSLFGVPKTTALSLSIVYHVANYVPITALGLAYLGAMNLTLGELRAAGEKA